MTAVILAFACGVMFLQLLPELPVTGWLWLSACGLVFFSGKRFLYCPVALVLGFCWALAMAQLRLADRLPPELEGRNIEVSTARWGPSSPTK